jgi:hypothetical protein
MSFPTPIGNPENKIAFVWIPAFARRTSGELKKPRIASGLFVIDTS